jgi:D-tagatose-1,6-bisphosphate aldolase subunit GatZ/KbaZ
MKKITVNEMMRAIYELEEKKGLKCTLLGIGPMSKPLIYAAFQLAKEQDFPIMFIASRNQIDTNELGGGYVCHWDQKKFVQEIDEIAKETQFAGIYHICRDHGGPWQRDNERNAKLPENEAMEKGKQSYLADLIAGFDLLHIDPTKDPHIDGVVPMDVVIKRTHELIAYVEKERVDRNLPPIAYEIGTEETNGGLTTNEAYTEFIRLLRDLLQKDNLPQPAFIVGQTGTLTRMTENIGHFNADVAKVLSNDARKFGVGLKEHNADYLTEFILDLHPALGITASNVAPEFGVAETQSYLLLAKIEDDLYKRKMIQTKSNFLQTIQEAAVKSERWRKWMVDDETQLGIKEIMADQQKVDLITEISGHYTFEMSDVIAEKEKMFDTLKTKGLNPERLVISAIKRSIGRYVDCFNLSGLTSKIYKVLNNN